MTASRAAHAFQPTPRPAEPSPEPSGFHQLDLLSLRADLRAPFRPGSVTVRAGSFPFAICQPSAEISRFRRRPLRRIPVGDVVEIGRPEQEQPPGRAVIQPVAAATAGRSKSVGRELFFLVVLAATVAGAFYSGRMHAFQRVIVVPAASSAHSVVTFRTDAARTAPLAVARLDHRVL